MSRLSRCFNIADLRLLAQKRLPKGLFEFIDRGSENEIALKANRDAFDSLMLETKFMVDLAKRDMGTTLFGKRTEFPLAIAPTGLAGVCWHKGEVGLAKAAARAGIPFTIAMGSISSLEEIAREVEGRLWSQIYPWRETQHTFDLVKRARSLPYEALVVTIDSALGRTREHNDRNGFTLPFRPNLRGLGHIAMRPGWLARVIGPYAIRGRLPRHENYPPQHQQTFRLTPGGGEPPRFDGMTWDDIARIRDMWPRTLIIKSPLTVEDAELAVKNGADGIVVSNHGGRALDSARPTIDALPEIVAAVGHKTTVMLDSGIRRGSDIVKALALGAKTVLIGRATLYGVAAGGQEGAERAIGILKNEFEKTMGYMGCRTVSELGPDRVLKERRPFYGASSGRPLDVGLPAHAAE